MSEDRNHPPPPAGEVSPKAMEGASPLQVRTRLPFEQKPGAPHPGFRAASFIYLAACLIMAGIALFMAYGRAFPLTSVPVIAPSIAAFYFFVRFMMMVRPKISGN